MRIRAHRKGEKNILDLMLLLKALVLSLYKFPKRRPMCIRMLNKSYLTLNSFFYFCNLKIHIDKKHFYYIFLITMFY